MSTFGLLADIERQLISMRTEEGWRLRGLRINAWGGQGSIISCALGISCHRVNDTNGTGSPKDAGRQFIRAQHDFLFHHYWKVGFWEPLRKRASETGRCPKRRASPQDFEE